MDDAAGEAFDKVARLLGLPYPGGPSIDKAARDGDPTAVAFPRPLTGPNDPALGFSFSGLKTAVARYVEKPRDRGQHRRHRRQLPGGGRRYPYPQGPARPAVSNDVQTLVVVGGVAANSRVRSLAQERCAAAGMELRIPPMRLCTDNGAMIAAIGDLLVRDGAGPVEPGLAAIPTIELQLAQLAVAS